MGAHEADGDASASLPKWPNFWAVMCALLFSAFYLRVSQAVGRLSQDITYDDIGYVNDAVARLDQAFHYGFWAYFKTFWDTPPHSPFSTILASIGIVVGGYNDSAIYATSSIILVIVSIFLVRQIGENKVALCIWILGFFLSSPLAFRTIHDFRPDLALGFCTGAMVWWFMAGLRDGVKKFYVYAGMAFGLALLIKPTFFAHTIALAFTLVGVQLLFFTKLKSIGWSSSVLRASHINYFFFIGLLLAGPYFLINGREIFSYFIANTRGEGSSIWSFSADESFFQVLKSYSSMVYQGTAGYHLYLSIIVAILPLSLFLRRKDYRSFFEIIFLWGFACVSFAIIFFGRHKNEFFFVSFQFLMFLAATVAVSRCRLRKKSFEFIAIVGLCLSLGVAIYFNQRIPVWQVSKEAYVRNGSWNSEIANLIAADLMRRGVDPLTGKDVGIFVSFAGPVSAQSIMWTATKKGWRWSVSDIQMSDNVAALLAAANSSQYVVLPNEMSAEYYRWLPNAKAQKKLFQEISSDNRFRRIPTSQSVQNYFVFANSTIALTNQPVISGDALVEFSGFMPEEGPYPQWQLPRVRWMSSKDASLCIATEQAGVYDLALRFRPELSGRLQIATAGQLFSEDFKLGEFKELHLSFDQPAGASCINIKALIGATPDTSRILLFTQLKIEKAK